MSLLTAITAVARRGIGTRGVRVADVVAGPELIGFGAAPAYASAGEA